MDRYPFLAIWKVVAIPRTPQQADEEDTETRFWIVRKYHLRSELFLDAFLRKQFNDEKYVSTFEND